MGYVREQHSEACNKLHDEWEKHNNEYVTKWPDYCTDCGGWGGHGTAGSYWDPPDFEVCDSCIGNGKCPRCAAETFTDDTVSKCSACGFTLDGLDCNGLPEPDYCMGFCKEPEDP